jgi:hypothetical protein
MSRATPVMTPDNLGRFLESLMAVRKWELESCNDATVFAFLPNSSLQIFSIH